MKDGVGAQKKHASGGGRTEMYGSVNYVRCKEWILEQWDKRRPVSRRLIMKGAKKFPQGAVVCLPS